MTTTMQDPIGFLTGAVAPEPPATDDRCGWRVYYVGQMQKALLADSSLRPSTAVRTIAPLVTREFLRRFPGRTSDAQLYFDPGSLPPAAPA